MGAARHAMLSREAGEGSPAGSPSPVSAGGPSASSAPSGASAPSNDTSSSTYRESLSLRQAGRGRHEAKRRAGEGRCLIAQSAQAPPPHPPSAPSPPAKNRGGRRTLDVRSVSSLLHRRACAVNRLLRNLQCLCGFFMQSHRHRGFLCSTAAPLRRPRAQDDRSMENDELRMNQC
jgi:hypothetical protein